MIDFSQYKFGETQKEEKRTVSRTKSVVFLIISFLVLFLALSELTLFLIIGFPKENLLIFIIANGVVALGSFVMMFISGGTTKFIKIQGEDYSKTKAASSIYLLTTMILLTITGIFVGRFVNPKFLDILFM